MWVVGLVEVVGSKTVPADIRLQLEKVRKLSTDVKFNKKVLLIITDMPHLLVTECICVIKIGPILEKERFILKCKQFEPISRGQVVYNKPKTWKSRILLHLTTKMTERAVFVTLFRWPLLWSPCITLFPTIRVQLFVTCLIVRKQLVQKVLKFDS